MRPHQSKNLRAIVIEGGTVAGSFATELAVVDQVKPVGVGAFDSHGGHEAEAAGGAVARDDTIYMLGGEAGGAVVAKCAPGGGNYSLTGFAGEAVVAGNEIFSTVHGRAKGPSRERV